MKKQGSKSDFISDRNRELHESFMEVLRTAGGVSLRDMFTLAVNRPASRFWVSENRAADVIGRMMRGIEDGDMLPKRRDMYREILRRVRRLMKGDATLCMTRAVYEVIYEEAPEFYMTPESARSIIYAMRRHKRKLQS